MKNYIEEFNNAQKRIAATKVAEPAVLSLTLVVDRQNCRGKGHFEWFLIFIADVNPHSTILQFLNKVREKIHIDGSVPLKVVLNDRELRNHQKTFFDYGFVNNDTKLSMTIKREESEYPIPLFFLYSINVF